MIQLSTINISFRKNNLYSADQNKWKKTQDNTSICSDSVHFTQSNRINNNSNKTAQKLSKILYIHRNIGLKPISFGSNPSTEMVREG